PAWDGSLQILAFSADTLEELAAATGTTPPVADNGFPWFARETRRTFHPSAKFRLVAVRETATGQTDDEFQQSLQAALGALREGSSWHAAPGIRASSGTRRTRLALLFPGQGAQRVDSFRELACVFPEMRAELEKARDAMARAFPDLALLDDLLYPPAPANQADAAASLRDTRVCQVVMGALGMGAARVLRRFHVGAGVDTLSAGHSLGEWTALASAGLLPDESWYRLLACRAGLMHHESLARQGTMLAVLAQRDDAEKLAAKVPGVRLANHNGPRQSILSGPVAAIAQCEGLAREAGLATRRLDVAGAFHHPDLAGASRALASALSEAHLPVDPGRGMATTVLANLDARPYTPGEPGWLERLHRQVAEPVLWQECVERLREQGAEVFLEVGTGGILTRMARDILADLPDVEART
ncbi:MAG: ACP S-malonyltransferase, partial [Gemmataceae bacterium]